MQTHANSPRMSRTTKKWLGIIGVLVLLQGATLATLIHQLHKMNGPRVTWHTMIEGKDVEISYFEKSPTHGSIDIGHFDTLEVRAILNLDAPTANINTMYIINYPGRVVTLIGHKDGKAPVVLRGTPVSEQQINDATALVAKAYASFRAEHPLNPA